MILLMDNVQSVIIPKNMFTISQADKWIIEHNFLLNFRNKGVDITKNTYRYRQKDPNKKYKYYTKILNNGIKLVIIKK